MLIVLISYLYIFYKSQVILLLKDNSLFWKYVELVVKYGRLNIVTSTYSLKPIKMIRKCIKLGLRNKDSKKEISINF